MLVLGVIKMHQPVHGYDVRKELVSWHVEEWASVQRGSIYSALKTLAKEGLVETAGTEQVGERPERTLYTITKAGEAELDTLLHDTLWKWEMPKDPLLPALSLMAFLERDELIAGLEMRAAKIKASLHNEYKLENVLHREAGRDTPKHVGEMLRLINARVSAELPWSKAFVERLKKGEYVTASDEPTRPAPKKAAAAKKRSKRA